VAKNPQVSRTDLTNVVVRDTALALGLVDIKVCAIDEVWSELKFVVRKDERSPGQSATPRPE
jgi:hypothetical protein